MLVRAGRVIQVRFEVDVHRDEHDDGHPPPTATEWIASASIDDAPVSAHATNLVTAIPVFASSAATTAFVPP